MVNVLITDESRLCCGVPLADLHQRLTQLGECTDCGLDLWDALSEQGRAHTYCAACPVQAGCLDYALEVEANAPSKQRWGCWGGLYPGDRKELVREFSRSKFEGELMRLRMVALMRKNRWKKRRIGSRDRKGWLGVRQSRK